jgi:hypothetical protein
VKTANFILTFLEVYYFQMDSWENLTIAPMTVLRDGKIQDLILISGIAVNITNASGGNFGYKGD